MSGRKRIHIGVMVLLTALIVVIVLRMDFRRASQALAGLDWRWALLVPVLNFVGVAVEALRWKLILSEVKRVALRSTFVAMLVGIIGNIVLPFKLGDSARAYALAREEDVSMTNAVSSVLLDRVADIIPFVVLTLVTGMFFSFPAGFQVTGEIGAGVLVVLAVVVTILFRSGRLGLPARIARSTRVARFAQMLRRFRAMFLSLHQTGRFLRVSVLSAVVWGIRLAIIYAMLTAFAMDLPSMAGLVTLIFVTLGIAAVSSPGNIGSFELAAAGALKLFGVETEVALSFAITLHVIEGLPIAVAGLVALWVTGIRLRDVAVEPLDLAAVGDSTA